MTGKKVLIKIWEKRGINAVHSVPRETWFKIGDEIFYRGEEGCGNFQLTDAGQIRPISIGAMVGKLQDSGECIDLLDLQKIDFDKR